MKKILTLLFLIGYISACSTLSNTPAVINESYTSEGITESTSHKINYNPDGTVESEEFVDTKNTQTDSSQVITTYPEEQKKSLWQKFISGVKEKMYTIFAVAGLIAIAICFIKFDVMGFVRTLLKKK